MKKKDIIIGRNSVIEALENGTGIDAIWVNQNSKDLGVIMKLADKVSIPVKKVPQSKIDYLLFPIFPNEKPNHQGVLAFVNDFQYTDLDDLYNQLLSQGKTATFVYLDSITDVGNFGAIARSALCFDIDGIIIPHRNSVSVNTKSIKSSAGALLKLPICRISNPIDTMEYLTNCGFLLIGADEKAEMSLEEMPTEVPTVIVLGNEGDGISRQVSKWLTNTIKIDMNTDIFDSLNVSVSAGIIFNFLYQARKKK